MGNCQKTVRSSLPVWGWNICYPPSGYCPHAPQYRKTFREMWSLPYLSEGGIFAIPPLDTALMHLSTGKLSEKCEVSFTCLRVDYLLTLSGYCSHAPQYRKTFREMWSLHTCLRVEYLLSPLWILLSCSLSRSVSFSSTFNTSISDFSSFNCSCKCFDFSMYSTLQQKSIQHHLCFMKKIHQLSVIDLPDTVESSLFMMGQCPWISWVTLNHQFTSPRMFNKVINCPAL